MKLSIIIPSFNTKELLDQCLTSIYASLNTSSVNYEVIVVDNSSTDGSVELVEKKYKRVILIKNKENLGFGKANNIAIKKSRGEYILLLNSDCMVIGNGIDELLKFAVNKHGFVGGKLFNEDGSIQPSCGPFYTLGVVFLMLFLKGDQLHLTRFSPNKNRDVDWVSGACLMGKRVDFESVGLFNESIFMYMEEIDLLFRAKKINLPTSFCASAHFTHVGAASSKDKRDPVVQIYRGLDYFYLEHYSTSEHKILRFLLRLKAWFVIAVCGIIGKPEIRKLYAKALDTIS